MPLRLRPLSTVHINVLLLLAAFACGQGAIFLAQTYLIAKGNAAFLGTTGIAYYTVVLLYFVADWGGIVTLTRIVAGSKISEISDAFWSLVVVRLALAGLAVPVLVGMAYRAKSGFELSFAITSVIGLPAHAFNTNGILDGRGKSGVAGLLSAIPVLFFATALTPAAFFSPTIAGYLLGSSYSMGVVVSTVLQHVMIRRYGVALDSVRFNRASALKSLSSGATYLAAVLPGQLFFRGQLWLSHHVLGASATGILVYAKQLLNAGMQLLQFVRRAEFPQLVAAVARGTDIRTATYTAQKTGLLLSIAGCFAITGFAFLLSLVATKAGSAPHLIAAFAPLAISGGVYLGLQQGYAAADRIATTIPVTWAYVVGSIALTYALLGPLSQYAFPVAEGVGQVIAASALFFLMRSPSANRRPPHHMARGEPREGVSE